MFHTCQRTIWQSNSILAVKIWLMRTRVDSKVGEMNATTGSLNAKFDTCGFEWQARKSVERKNGTDAGQMGQ